jgi:hypothetical protein
MRPPTSSAVEFGPASTAPTDGGSTVGGDMYYLVAGPSGPQRGSGFAYQLKYDISPEGPAAFQLNMHPAPNSGFGGAFRYSPCPREFEVEWYTKLLLVRNGVERLTEPLSPESSQKPKESGVRSPKPDRTASACA